jgi:hypothetical protein
MELFPPWRFTTEASMARFVSEIAPLPVASTVPLVRKARVEVPVGAIAWVIEMVPELDPPSSPIRITPVVIRFSSVLVRDSFVAASAPRSIAVALLRGAIVTIPPGVAVTRFAESSTASEITLICPVDPVLVNAEEFVNEAVRKVMSPAIVFAAEAGTDMVWVFVELPTSKAFAVDEITIPE